MKTKNNTYDLEFIKSKISEFLDSLEEEQLDYTNKCPNCGNIYLDYSPPLWDDLGINGDIMCPKCGHEWNVECEVKNYIIVTQGKAVEKIRGGKEMTFKEFVKLLTEELKLHPSWGKLPVVFNCREDLSSLNLNFYSIYDTYEKEFKSDVVNIDVGGEK